MACVDRHWRRCRRSFVWVAPREPPRHMSMAMGSFTKSLLSGMYSNRMPSPSGSLPAQKIRTFPDTAGGLRVATVVGPCWDGNFKRLPLIDRDKIGTAKTNTIRIPATRFPSIETHPNVLHIFMDSCRQTSKCQVDGLEQQTNSSSNRDNRAMKIYNIESCKLTGWLDLEKCPWLMKVS